MPACRITSVVCATLILIAICVSARPSDAQPAHDDCVTARPIAGPPFAPFVDVVDTTTATLGVTDPVGNPCNSAENNVWYRFVAPQAMTLELLTAGSNYDTVVIVYAGSCGSLSEIALGDDIPLFPVGTTQDSQVLVPLNAGDSILISVASIGAGGGSLTLTAREAAVSYRRPKSLDEIILSSDPSPLGGSYGVFDMSIAASKRDFVFASRTQMIAIETPSLAGTVHTTIATAGDATPIGGTFADFGLPATNDSGDVVFQAKLDNAPTNQAIFLWSGAVLSSVVQAGDLSPSGDVMLSLDDELTVNEIGLIVFRAGTASGDQLLVANGALLTLMASEDDVSPCGGTISRLGGSRPFGIAIEDLGTDVVFHARARGAGSKDAILVSDGVTLTAIACEDGATPIGGTFNGLGEQPAINNAGEVFFLADISGAAVSTALFSSVAAVVTAKQSPGDVMATGETVLGYSLDTEVEATTSGYLAFQVGLSAGSAIALWPPAALAPDALVVSGDACPAGGTFDLFDPNVSVSSAGDVAFDGRCTSTRGPFLIPTGGAVLAGSDALTTTTIGTGFRFRFARANALGQVASLGVRSSVYLSRCSAGTCPIATTLASATLTAPGLQGYVEYIYGETLNGVRKSFAFLADTAGSLALPASSSQALMRLEKGVLEKIAQVGDPLPGAVGTYDSFPSSGSEGGDKAVPAVGRKVVAFYATITGHPTAGSGIFAFSKQGQFELALEGNVSPTGGIYEELGAPTVRRKSVLFRAKTNIDDCLYAVRKPGQPVGVILCEGDPAPVSVGGTIGTLARVPPSGSPRRAVFAAEIQGGNANECVMLARNGVAERLYCDTDPFPTGPHIRNAAVGNPAVTPAAESTGKGFAGQMDIFIEGCEMLGEGVIAERKGKFYLLTEPFQLRGPVSGGELGFDGLGPISMTKKVVTYPVTSKGTVRYAIWRAVLP